MMYEKIKDKFIFLWIRLQWLKSEEHQFCKTIQLFLRLSVLVHSYLIAFQYYIRMQNVKFCINAL